MATPHAVLPHALEQIQPSRPSAGHVGWLRSGLLLGVTAALTVTVLPGTAAAAPGEVTDATQAAQRVAESERELEVVTEDLNEAKVQLEQQQAAVASAEQAAVDARAQLDALDGQVRQLARSAYTGAGFSRLDILLTSDSPEDLVHQLSTLDAIAAQQEELKGQIAHYQREFDALSAPQQEQVALAHGGGAAQVVPSGVIAASAAAQTVVDTALAQVGDAYVWGAGGPDAFDCSGLTTYAYSAAGVSLPRSSKSQAQTGAPVAVSDLQPGDLLFFYNPTSHVAMYIGNGQMVHASTPSKPVSVASFDSMSGDFTHARRIAG